MLLNEASINTQVFFLQTRVYDIYGMFASHPRRMEVFIQTELDLHADMVENVNDARTS